MQTGITINLPQPTRLFTSIATLAILALAILLPRVFDLGAFQAADEKMWVANTQNFTRNLATFKWDQLLQQAHPGITTTWLGALTINYPSLATRKLPLALAQSVLIGLTGYIFYRLWGKKPAVLLTLLLALNPFLTAHTRVYAMDSLLAHFLLLSLGCLLLWRAQRATRYLVFAAVAGALAVLSKLPGIIIVPHTLAILIYDAYVKKSLPTTNYKLQTLTFLWLVSFLLTIVIIFPSLVLNFPEVKQRTLEFITEGDAQDVHHAQARYNYYLQTLAFFSTPLHFAALLAVPFAWRASGRADKETAAVLLLTAVLFIAAMSLGAKKGDRYILPAFLLLDALAAFVAVRLAARTPRLARAVWAVALLGLAWQAVDVARLHPYALAYVNPLAKPLYGERRLGWGEGLDLAAKHLNAKPDARSLTVASPYPTEFAYTFAGRTIPLNHYTDAKPDYVIIYRSLFERGEHAWETEILHEFQSLQPEKIITLNGLPYAWIYPAVP